jgi:hypothetical protein
VWITLKWVQIHLRENRFNKLKFQTLEMLLGMKFPMAADAITRRPWKWISMDRSCTRSKKLKGNGVATLAQNKIFPAKQELLLSEITGLRLDAQMQRNRLDVDERVEGSRQCSCSRPS